MKSLWYDISSSADILIFILIRNIPLLIHQYLQILIPIEANVILTNTLPQDLKLWSKHFKFFFYQKFFLPKVFWTSIFWAQFVLYNQQIFLDQKFFSDLILLTQNVVQSKKILDPKLFLTQSSFLTHISFLTQNLTQPRFLAQHFYPACFKLSPGPLMHGQISW